MIGLFNDDCLKILPAIPSQSIDAVICDPPYGTTACKWDSVIPFAPMWAQLKRVIKKNGAIVLFGAQPFTSALIMSNPNMFKYDWVWEKNVNSNFMLCKKQPLRHHENILVFSHSATVYNPQMEEGKPYIKKRAIGEILNTDHFQTNFQRKDSVSDKRYPKTVIRISRDERQVHPTQKPVALLEYLIKTYTNEGDIVLDFTMGSGTTGVAAVKLKRNFIGIELNQEYFQIAQGRIKAAEEANGN